MNKIKWLTHLSNGTLILGVLSYMIFTSSIYYVEGPLHLLLDIAICFLILSNLFLNIKLDFVEKNKIAKGSIFIIALNAVAILLAIVKLVMK